MEEKGNKSCMDDQIMEIPQLGTSKKRRYIENMRVVPRGKKIFALRTYKRKETESPSGRRKKAGQL